MGVEIPNNVVVMPNAEGGAPPNVWAVVPTNLGAPAILPADITAQLGALPAEAVAQAVQLLQQAFKKKSTANAVQADAPAVSVGEAKSS